MKHLFLDDLSAQDIQICQSVIEHLFLDDLSTQDIQTCQSVI